MQRQREAHEKFVRIMQTGLKGIRENINDVSQVFGIDTGEPKITNSRVFKTSTKGSPFSFFESLLGRKPKDDESLFDAVFGKKL